MVLLPLPLGEVASRSDDGTPLNSPSRLWRQIPLFVTCGDIFPRPGEVVL